MHLGGSQWLAHWFSNNAANGLPLIPMSEMHLSESTEWTLMLFTTGMALVVIVVSYFIYQKRDNLPVADAAQTGLIKVIANKFYIDEIYDFLIVKPIGKLSKFLHYYVDIQAIDGIVNGTGKGVEGFGAFMRRLQNGNIEYYLLGMVVGILMLMLSLFI